MTGGARGVLTFVLVAIIGWQITAAVRDRVLPYPPAEEAFQSMARDFQAIEYTFIGWFITLILALTAACATRARSHEPWHSPMSIPNETGREVNW